ncbi:uncharacterized protein ACMZJ9_009979 [Mantella aurantiaca]
MPGHGKSSLINTCVCIVQNEENSELKNVAGAGTSSDPITTERKDFHLSEKIVITDNRGVSKMSKEELMEMKAQFCHLRGRDKVEWNRSLRQYLDCVLEFLHQNKEAIIPICVYSAKSLITKERYAELEPFIREVHRITGIYPIIVLTHFQDDITKSASHFNKFKEIGAEHIFQIENYTMERNDPNPETKSTVLALLDTCLQEADRKISGNRMEDFQEMYIKNAMDVIEGKMNIELEHQNKYTEEMQIRHEAAGERAQAEFEYKDNENEELRKKNQALQKEIEKLRKRKKSCSVM